MTSGATESHAEPELLIGGRYRLVGRLGAGGYGRVWRAHDTQLAVDIAIKEVVLPAVLADHEQAERLQRAEREARNAARLRGHAHIVTVYDVVVQDGVPWTVMQLIEGQSLEDHLSEHGPLHTDPAACRAEVVQQVGASSNDILIPYSLTLRENWNDHRSPGAGTWLYWLFLLALPVLYTIRDILTRRARRAVPTP